MCKEACSDEIKTYKGSLVKVNDFTGSELCSRFHSLLPLCL